MNMKADILSRKDQVDTKEDNKDIKMLKNELWTRRVTTEVEVVKEITLLEKFKKIKQENKKFRKNWKKTKNKHGKIME